MFDTADNPATVVVVISVTAAYTTFVVSACEPLQATSPAAWRRLKLAELCDCWRRSKRVSCRGRISFLFSFSLLLLYYFFSIAYQPNNCLRYANLLLLYLLLHSSVSFSHHPSFFWFWLLFIYFYS